MVAASSYLSGLQNISAANASVDSSSWGGAIGKQKRLIEDGLILGSSCIDHLYTETEGIQLLMELFHSEIS